MAGQILNPKGRSVLIRAMQELLFSKILSYGYTGPFVDDVLVNEEDEHSPIASLFHFRHHNILTSNRYAISIDVYSYSRPTFSVIGGRVPPEGVRRLDPDELVPPDRVNATWLREYAYLQAWRPQWYSPFRQPLIPYLLGSHKGIRECVERAAMLLPHLIDWLEKGVESRHVFVSKFPPPQPMTDEEIKKLGYD